MRDVAKPLACIECTVYNHENFLRECLDGFVMQKTDFPFVAVVHDDASTDNSASIIKEYAEKYPDIIKPIFETENQFSKPDLSLPRIMSEAIDKYNPRYLAICEGDDYWTDPNKLQKQVDFMETHPDYSICFHDVNLYYQSTNSLSDHLDVKDVPETTTILDLAQENYIHYLSVLYRYNTEVFKQWEQIGDTLVGDYVSHMLYAKMGKIFRMKEKMGVYRIHSGGCWSMQMPGEKIPVWCYALSKISFCFDSEVREVICMQMNDCLDYYKHFGEEIGEDRIKCTKQYRIGKVLLNPLTLFKHFRNRE